jgi:hypothetical protein
MGEGEGKGAVRNALKKREGQKKDKKDARWCAVNWQYRWIEKKANTKNKRRKALRGNDKKNYYGVFFFLCVCK